MACLRQVQKSDRTTRTQTRTSPGRINSDLPGSTRTELKFHKMSSFLTYCFTCSPQELNKLIMGGLHLNFKYLFNWWRKINSDWSKIPPILFEHLRHLKIHPKRRIHSRLLCDRWSRRHIVFLVSGIRVVQWRSQYWNVNEKRSFGSFHCIGKVTGRTEMGRSEQIFAFHLYVTHLTFRFPFDSTAMSK